MTDRPDDLLAGIDAILRDPERTKRGPLTITRGQLELLERSRAEAVRLADALEAAQKEKDWWYQRSLGAESEATFEQSQSDRLRARVRQLEEALAAVWALVDAQAEDEALWALNLDGTLPISEAYLQQELRALHSAVENARGVLAAKENT